MKMLMRTYIDGQDGTEALKSGAMQKTIQSFIETFKPEATYFTVESGSRSGLYVFDMKDSSQMPALGEPFFALGCRVTLMPCMGPQDLHAGLAAAEL